MAKRYIAIGRDVDGDVVATDLAKTSSGEAVDSLKEMYDEVVVHHLIEIDVPSPKKVTSPTITKLKIS